MNECLNTLFLGRKFKNLLKLSFEPIREKYDLKQTEIEVLSYLAIYPSATSTEVYQNLNLNKGHVSQSTIHLQSLNLIALHTNPNDKRSATYSLTEKGKQAYDDIMKEHSVLLNSLLHNISDKELKSFLKTSSKIMDNIDNILNQ